MIFGGIQRTSTIDFPGVLSCVVFTKGCDLDCFYCHNRALLGDGEEMPQSEVLAFLEKRRGLLDGVVVSGGEPTLQKDLELFIRTVREMGYRVKLDTNGQRPDIVETLVQKALLDYVAVDVKATEQAYVSVCKVAGYARAKETVSCLLAAGASFEVRTTLYPGMRFEELQGILKSFPKVPLWRLNYFRMPENAPKELTARLNLHAMNEKGIEPMIAGLTKYQPNLKWK